MRLSVLFSILFLTVINLFSQKDTIKNSFDSGKGFLINAKLIDKNVVIDETKNTDLSYLFYKKKTSSPLSYSPSVDVYLNPNKAVKNMVMQPKPHEENKDVLVVKHFNGQDTSVKKFKTSQHLGTIQSNTKFVRIEYRDFGLVDGDRVRVFLNEKEIDANVHLNGLFYTLHIKLDKKGFNKIDIQAINQGYVGPNTAEFVVYDDKGNVVAHKTWNLQKGAIATLGIVRY